MTSAEEITPDQLVTIAMIGGTDEETRKIVEDALKSIGAPSFTEGSVVYGVQVFHRDSQRATEALKSDPRLADHWIIYVHSPET